MDLNLLKPLVSVMHAPYACLVVPVVTLRMARSRHRAPATAHLATSSVRRTTATCKSLPSVKAYRSAQVLSATSSNCFVQVPWLGPFDQGVAPACRFTQIPRSRPTTPARAPSMMCLSIRTWLCERASPFMPIKLADCARQFTRIKLDLVD